MTRPDEASPKNARGVGPKCSGPSLHERIGSAKYSVVCATAGVTPLGLGGNWLPPIVTSRSAPHTKRTRHETAAVHCTCTISLCSYTCTPAQPHVVTRQTLSAQHGTRERDESHDTALAQLSLSKQVSSTRVALVPLCLAPCWRSRFGVVFVPALRVPLAQHACLSSVPVVDWTGLAGRARLDGVAGGR